MSGQYLSPAAMRSQKIAMSDRGSAIVSDMTVVCGKLLANGQDRNTPSHTRV